MADVELTDEVKTFIVTELACFETPSAIVKALKEDFKIEVSRQRVHCYDPTKKAGQGLSAELRQVFEETRKKFLEDTAQIGVANKTYRLRMLDKGVQHFASVSNYMAMADLLERAAKEMGGAYTNKQQHEHSGPNGAPLAATVILTGAPPGASAPQAVGGVPHKGN